MPTQILAYPAAKLIPLLSSLLRHNVRTKTACPTVVGSRFCVPHPLVLFVENKLSQYFVIKDINKKVMLTVKSKFFSPYKRVLLDNVGQPVLTLQWEPFSLFRRWEAFRGESTDPGNLLFSICKSHSIPFRTKLDVFFASNTKEHISDFKLEGVNWLNQSYTVTLGGDTSTIIAQIKKDPSILPGNDDFRVNAYPNVDYAFLVALVVTLSEIESVRHPKYYD